MKIARLFTIDEEIARTLSTISNQSNLVNQLLKEHFASVEHNALTNLEQEMKKKRLEIKQFKQKMRKIQEEKDRNQKVLKQFQERRTQELAEERELRAKYNAWYKRNQFKHFEINVNDFTTWRFKLNTPD